MANQSRQNQGNTQFPQINTPEIRALIECMNTCKACAKKCIEGGNKKTALLCGECCEICDLAIKYKCCDSEFTQQVLDLCGQVCRQCATECNRIESAHCHECAEACRRCAEVCTPALSNR